MAARRGLCLLLLLLFCAVLGAAAGAEGERSAVSCQLGCDQRGGQRGTRGGLGRPSAAGGALGRAGVRGARRGRGGVPPVERVGKVVRVMVWLQGPAGRAPRRGGKALRGQTAQRAAPSGLVGARGLASPAL